MLKGLIFGVLSVVSMVALDGDVASAGDGAGTVANSPQRELVNYRLENWKTAHAESGKKGEQLVATLKKLRCEVSVSSHGGHQDVKYRCVKWQQLSLKSHKEAHQWEAWLKQYGFATKHEH